MNTKNNVMTDKFFINTNSTALGQEQIDNILAMNTDKVKKTGVEIPKGDNIVVFKGIISQNYGVGEASRNRYKYDQKGWILDEYNPNPVILWQHNQDYGTIGHAVQFWLDEENNYASLFYVDLDTLEPRHANQIKNGYVKGISTGAQTVEYMFEDNETGERLTEDEAEEKYGWENVWRAFAWGSDFITLVITKAKLLEYSMVTIGSNAKAIAMQNSIGDSFAKKAEEYKNSKNGSNPANLSPNSTSMENPEIKKDTTTDDESGASATSTPEAEAGTQDESEVATADSGEAAAGTDTNSVQVSEVDTLKLSIDKMKQDHANEIATIKKEYEDKLTLELNKIRADERTNLAKVVSEQNNVSGGDVKTTEDFARKYIPQR